MNLRKTSSRPVRKEMRPSEHGILRQFFGVQMLPGDTAAGDSTGVWGSVDKLIFALSRRFRKVTSAFHVLLTL